MLAGLLVGGLALQILAFGPSAVWRPDVAFRAKVLAACESNGTAFGQCFREQMKAMGASAQAAQFTQRIQDGGYMAAFRPVGRVSIAAVNYPFRANENNGLYLVNGDPVAVDVDDMQRLQAVEIKKRYPDGTLLPGDRSAPGNILALAFPDGSQRFIVDYRVQRGCHACALLAQAFFSFAFDSHGRFTGVTMSGLTSDSSPAQFENRKIVSLKRGETISIVLPSNQSTGYSWNLAPSSASSGLKRLGHKYQAPSRSPPGAEGQDLWTFQAESTGDSSLLLQYTRPWEKNQHAAVSLTVTVRVE